MTKSYILEVLVLLPFVYCLLVLRSTNSKHVKYLFLFKVSKYRKVELFTFLDVKIEIIATSPNA